MKQKHWLQATDIVPMMFFLRDKPNARKKRLFGCACCRLVWDSFTSNTCHQAIEVAERFADNRASSKELQDACLRVENNGQTNEGGGV